MEVLNELWTPFADFWTITQDVLDNTAFGTSFGRLLIAIVVFGVLLVLRGLFSRFVVGWLKRFVKRTQNQIDDHMVAALDSPIRFVPIVLGFFVATEVLQLEGTFDTLALRVTRSLIVFTLFWGTVALVEPVSLMFGQLRDILSPTMREWILKAIRILLSVIGAAAILQLWGCLLYTSPSPRDRG